MRRAPMILIVAAASLTLGVAVTAAGGTPAKQAPPADATPAVATTAATKTVVARIRGFAPKRLTVAKGTMVRFRNADRASHNAVATRKIGRKSAFTSGAPVSGAFSIRAPRRAGAFAYICQVHPLTMKGTIVVK